MLSSCLLFASILKSETIAGQEPPKANTFQGEIDAMLARDAENPPPKNAIVFIGSSSIKGWKTLAQDFPNHQVVNRGFGGSQLSDSIYFAPKIVLPLQPKMVVLFAGTNDINAGKKAETVAEDFSQFVKLIRAELPKTRIAFISVTSSPSRWKNDAEVRKANYIVKSQCISGDNLVFIDTYSLMLTAESQPMEDIFVSDKLHLNAKGYQIWKKAVSPFLPW